RNIVAPLGLGMIRAVVGENAQLTILRRSENETCFNGCSCAVGFLTKSARVRAEMMFSPAVAFCFPMEISIFDVNPDGKTDIRIRRKCFASGLLGAGTAEMK